jgi:hypothetical protein
MTPEVRDAMVGTMLERLREGFADDAAILADVVSCACADLLEPAATELRDAAPSMLAEALARHLREQARWPTVTDCDRLDAAFAELNERGLFARHHWWCCENCGFAAMVAEERASRGYVFYHRGDTAAAMRGNGLCLSYGSLSDDDEADDAAVAREVFDVLRRHGLDPSWDGDVTSRIRVPLIWQRRAR